jgi:predicted DNA-binding protein (MmcQ/YjbR family)
VDVDGEGIRRLARASSLALDAGEYADTPPEVTDRVRSVATALPEVVERQAWAGTQWRVRDRAFAHVLTIDFPAGPVTALTFRSSGPELDALRDAGLPWFRPAWGADAAGLVLDGGTDWKRVADLVEDSYRVVAPRKLTARIADRPRSRD